MIQPSKGLFPRLSIRAMIHALSVPSPGSAMRLCGELGFPALSRAHGLEHSSRAVCPISLRLENTWGVRSCPHAVNRSAPAG